jgi:DNA-binding response OmpR family regulator
LNGSGPRSSFSISTCRSWVHALAALGIELPIVVMTSDPEADRYARDLGAAGYVSKPFLVDQLMSRVRESLGRAA